MEKNNLDLAAEERKRRLEILFYVLAFVIAAGMRFIKLGALPFGSGEASLAMQALGAAQGTALTVGSEPGYTALTALIFSVFSASGFWARFWPALAGSLIVFTPLLFKEKLGRNVSILLALLFAIDPGLTAVSRSAGGSMLTIACFLAMCGLLYKRRSLWAGVFAGLFILGGVTSWPALITLAVIALFYILSLPKGTAPGSLFSGIDGKKFFSAFIASILLIGTGFILYPKIINGLGSGVLEFFTAFFARDGVSLKLMFISLPISEVFLLPLSIWGLVIGIKHRDRLSEILGVSAVMLILLVLLNSSRQVTDWVWTIIPLTVLAAFGLEDLIKRFDKTEIGVTSVQVALTMILLMFSFLNLLGMLTNPPIDVSSTRLAIIEVALPLAFLIVVTLLMAFGWSMTGAKQGFVAGIGLMLLFVSFGNAIKAGGLGPRPEMEFWRAGALPTGRDLLLKTTNELSLYSTGTENDIEVAILDVDSPELSWGLHDYKLLKPYEYIGETDRPAIIISSPDSQIRSTASYRGQEILWTSRVDYDNMSASDWLRWFTLRQAPIINESLLIWARNDLFTGS
jgi:hypothetical protein